MKEPIGSHATPLTRLEWPLKTAVQIPLVIFHIWMVLSKLPLAKEESSGDQLRSTYFKHGQIDPKLIKIIENYKHSNKELEARLEKNKK